MFRPSTVKYLATEPSEGVLKFGSSPYNCHLLLVIQAGAGAGGAQEGGGGEGQERGIGGVQEGGGLPHLRGQWRGLPHVSTVVTLFK